MKEFCKNHRKELAFVIFYLAYVYVACYVLYTSYHGDFRVYLVSSPYRHVSIPPRWTLYLECAKLHLPGLFLILAWISLINHKKGLYVFFALITFGNLFLVWYTPVYFWFQGDTYNNIEYLIVISVFFLVSFFYFLGRKKQWVFWIFNITVFFTAINRELKELQKLFHYLIESRPNIFGWISYLPHWFIDTLLRDWYNFLKILIYNNILKIDVDSVENLKGSIILIREKLGISEEYINWLWENGAVRAIELSPRYYWYIRVFLLASILILGILLSHQCYNNKKKSYLHKGIKN